MSPWEVPDEAPWPEPPSDPPQAQVDFAKMHYQAQIDEVKARYQAAIDEAKAQWRDAASLVAERRKQDAAHDEALAATDDKLREAVHGAYLEVAKGSLDRSLQRANFVTAVAGAAGTSYAALLALVYSVSADTPNPMPARGILPTIFFGISLLLCAYYIAYIRAATRRGHYIPAGTGPHIRERRMLFFVEWIMGSVTRLAWALRTSLVSLGVGLALIPLPFLKVSNTFTVAAAISGAVVLGVTLWLESRSS